MFNVKKMCLLTSDVLPRVLGGYCHTPGSVQRMHMICFQELIQSCVHIKQLRKQPQQQ